MKKIIMFVLIFCYAVTVQAAVHTVYATSDYTMGDGENKTQAENKALLIAKQVAAEQVGVYVESYTEVENLKLKHDEIITISAAVMKIVGREFSWSITPNQDFFVVCKIVAEVDDANIDDIVHNSVARHENELLKKKVNALENKVYTESHSNPMIDSLIAEGDSYCERMDYDNAMKKYEMAYSLGKTNIKAGTKLMRIYTMMRRYRDAKDIGDNLIKTYPMNPDVHWEMGIMYFRAGKKRNANKYLSNAVDYGCDNAFVLAQIAYCLADERKYDEAMKYFELSLQRKPCADTYFLLGLTYADMGQNENAMNAYKCGLQYDSHHAGMLFALGDMYERNIKWEDFSNGREAIRCYTLFLSAPKDESCFRYEIGEAEARRKHLKRQASLYT